MNTWTRFVRERSWLLLTAAILLAVLLRWPSLVQPIDNDGGARAYHARLILAGEPLYSTHHTGHHLPAIYYTYATAMSLFGDSNWAIKFFLILWTIPTIYVLYRLGVLVADRNVALLGAAFYAILSAHVNLWGQTAETELFANLPRITAVFLLLTFTKSWVAPWKYLFVGLLGAVTFWFKAVYLSPITLAGLVLLGEGWRKRQETGVWNLLFKWSLWLTVGLLVGLLPVLLYFGSLGLLPRLLKVFALGQAQVSAPVVDSNVLPLWVLYPLLPLFGLAVNNAALLAFGLAGFLLIVITRKEWLTPRFYLALWFLLSCIEAGANLELFAHYYLLIVPSLSLLAAWFLLKLFRDISLQKQIASLASLVLIGLLLLTFGLSIEQNAPYYSHYLRYRLGVESLAASVENGWPDFGERLVRAQVVSEYVVNKTAASDKIFVWSEDVQLYYLANRRSPIDMIWPRKVAVTAVPADILQSETRYIIIDTFRERDPEIPGWLLRGVAADYILETVIDGQEIYRRQE